MGQYNYTTIYIKKDIADWLYKKNLGVNKILKRVYENRDNKTIKKLILGGD